MPQVDCPRIAFPASLDSLASYVPTNPTTAPQNGPSHSQHHTLLAEAIEALEVNVGADSSAVTTSHDYRIRALETAVAATGSVSFVTKTSNYTATASDSIILCDASGGAFTVTLPPAASAANKVLTIKKIDDSDNFVTVDGDGTEPIDGSATRILPVQNNSVQVGSNGTAWYVL